MYRIAALSLVLVEGAVTLITSGHKRGLDAALLQRLARESANRAYFVGDPNIAGTLRPWQWIETGSDYPVAAYPHGVSQPGVVTVAADPLGRMGKVYRLTVTPRSNSPTGTHDADWAALFNSPTAYYGRNGQSDWIHFLVMFPAGEYRPTRGDWNWFFEEHNDSGFVPWYTAGQIPDEIPELALGVANDRGAVKQLLMQVRGGQDTHMLGPRRIYSHVKLQYDHWYSLVVHEKWSSDAAQGFIAWWVDGRRIFAQHLANLWQRPDGSYDHVNFEFNNYRVHASWDSTVYYGPTAIGPSRGSVAFPRGATPER